MTTEKQIAANRANATRSTGPRSAVGKLSSSRNAYRHGLSCPLRFDSAKVEGVTPVLVDEGASEQQLAAAAVFAEAQLELLRIRGFEARLAERSNLVFVTRKRCKGCWRWTATNVWPTPDADGRLTCWTV